MDNRPVGILDSGLGGLTALKEFKKFLPDEDIIFFGDSARAPYGVKDKEEIKTCARNILSYFVSSGVKAVLAACGTISVNARDVLAACPVPANNVLDPTIQYVSELPDNNPIGIIATPAAINSRGFEKALRSAGIEREIVPVACPDFVPLIEAGFSSDDYQIIESVAKYLKPVKDVGAGTLILGCTHYGIIEPAIRDYLGNKVELVSASKCGAKAFSRLLTTQHMNGGTGKVFYYTSGNAEEFRNKASLILGYDIGEVVSLPAWNF